MGLFSKEKEEGHDFSKKEEICENDLSIAEEGLSITEEGLSIAEEGTSVETPGRLPKEALVRQTTKLESIGLRNRPTNKTELTRPTKLEESDGPISIVLESRLAERWRRTSPDTHG